MTGFRMLAQILVGVLGLGTSARSVSAQPTDPAGKPAASTTSGEQSAPAPVIVPPQVLYTPQAVYPAEALKARQQAEVLLKLTVGVDGTVTAAEVVNPIGQGFDEAALDVARRFVFTPAQRNGVPVAVAINYLYRFEIPATAQAGEGTVGTAASSGEMADETATTSGILEGRVLIAGPEIPLAGVRVTLTDPAGSAREIWTDAEGRFSTGEVAAGEYKVSVRADGFDTLDVSEIVAVGEATAVVYRLSEVSEGIEVVVEGAKLPREVTRRTLERREITKVPGTGGDALRAIQSLPGVARPPGLAGILIVRGSSPQDTNIFFDGALVPLVYHFGGLSSVVPTELLDRIDFYPGNFSARYGRVTGGAIDVGLRSPNTNCTAEYGRPLPEAEDPGNCFHGVAQADLIDTRLLIQGPIAKDWSFALAGRRSWLDAWLGPVLEAAGAGVTAAPVYYDYQAFVEYKPNKQQKLRFQFYGSDDALKLLINNPSAQDAAFSGTLQFATSFYRGQAVYEQQLTRDVELNTTLAIGRDTVTFGIGPLAFSVDTYPIELRTEFGWKLFKGAKLNTGIDLWAAPYDVSVRAPLPPSPGEPSRGPLSAQPFLETEESSEIFRPGWYAEAELQPTERWQVVPGLRVDYSRDTSSTDFSPRINARYMLRGAPSDQGEDGQKVRKTALKGGLGYFFKPPEFQETNEVFGTPNLKSNRALHATLGVEQELTEQLDLSVEAYWKDLDRQVVGGTTTSYANIGTGRVLGAEVLLKYKPDARFFGWVAYTLSQSTRKNGPDDEEYSFQFDQTHNLILLGSYRLGDGWELGARYRIVSGNMVTPVQGFPNLSALYNADTGSYAPLQGKVFSERLPLFHQIDIRLEKAWQFADWRFSGYLDVWNAYNNQAVEGLQYNFNYSKVSYQTGLPIIPSLGLRGEF